MANEDLNKNYKQIMSMACDYNSDNYDNEDNQIWVCDTDDGISIEDDQYFFN